MFLVVAPYLHRATIYILSSRDFPSHIVFASAVSPVSHTCPSSRSFIARSFTCAVPFNICRNTFVSIPTSLCRIVWFCQNHDRFISASVSSLSLSFVQNRSAADFSSLLNSPNKKNYNLQQQQE